MINNLPIYRAKKIDSDEYVEGYLCSSNNGVNTDNKICIQEFGWWTLWEIDTSTLSIHFPDMLDSNGNKIFASLQKDGKGGDIVEYKGRKYTFGYKKEYFKVGLLNFRGWQLTTSDLLKVKTIGIQE